MKNNITFRTEDRKWVSIKDAIKPCMVNGIKFKYIRCAIRVYQNGYEVSDRRQQMYFYTFYDPSIVQEPLGYADDRRVKVEKLQGAMLLWIEVENGEIKIEPQDSQKEYERKHNSEEIDLWKRMMKQMPSYKRIFPGGDEDLDKYIAGRMG